MRSSRVCPGCAAMTSASHRFCGYCGYQLLSATERSIQYAGFWLRLVATLIDSLLIALITVPLLVWVYYDAFVEAATLGTPGASMGFGWPDFWIQFVLPMVLVIIFWRKKSATPGKMMISAVIVDSKTGAKPTTGQFVIRYLGYIVSTVPLCLGFMWGGWHSKKQGWHDIMAGTVVIIVRPN